MNNQRRSSEELFSGIEAELWQQQPTHEGGAGTMEISHAGAQTGLQQLDPEELGLENGRPFSLERALYHEKMRLLHKKQVAALDQRADHILRLDEMMNQAAEAQVAATVATCLQRVQERELVERATNKTGAIRNLASDWVQMREEIKDQVGQWDDDLAKYVYAQINQVYKNAADELLNLSVSPEQVGPGARKKSME